MIRSPTPHDILQRASSRLVYDLFAYRRTPNDPQPQPATVYALTRETHDADLEPGEQTKIQHSFSYSDGFGREIQKKIQAEPGPLAPGGPSADPRWVGSGWTIFNNKGKPVRKYEPFFTGTHEFEFARIAGVSSVIFYDPAGRVVGALHPNHTWEKTVFDPWRQESMGRQRHGLYRRSENRPSRRGLFPPLAGCGISAGLVFTARGRGDGRGRTSRRHQSRRPCRDAGRRAFADSLGRPFLTVAHNRFERNGAIVDEKYATRSNWISRAISAR